LFSIYKWDKPVGWILLKSRHYWPFHKMQSSQLWPVTAWYPNFESILWNKRWRILQNVLRGRSKQTVEEEEMASKFTLGLEAAVSKLFAAECARKVDGNPSQKRSHIERMNKALIQVINKKSRFPEFCCIEVEYILRKFKNSFGPLGWISKIESYFQQIYRILLHSVVYRNWVTILFKKQRLLIGSLCSRFD